MKKTILAAILPTLLIFSAIVSAQTNKIKISEVKAVSSVDLKQYSGKWYEIARYTNNARKNCAGNTTINYALMENNDIEVTNECVNKDGVLDTLKMTAQVTDKNSNAKFKIKKKKKGFLSAFSSDSPDVYWVLDIGSDYNYSVIGDPKREDFRILSRQPEMNDATYQRILRFAETIGYNPAKVYKTPQNLEVIKGEIVDKNN